MSVALIIYYSDDSSSEYRFFYSDDCSEKNIYSEVYSEYQKIFRRYALNI